MGVFNLNNLLRDNIKRIAPYSSARDEYVSNGSKMVFLDANENPYDNGVNRYPDPLQRSLKEVLASQKGINPSQILLGNGSDEVLDLIFRAFCTPSKDSVITMSPTYGMYKVLADINEVEIVDVPLTKDFAINTQEVIASIKNNSKVLFVCSPNNPSANLLDRNAIDKLLTHFNGVVVIDEAYIDFAPEKSWIESLDQYPNLIVTQTLSKAYGMAGIRLGMLFASTEIVSVLNKIKPPYNVNELTQQKALERVLDQEAVRVEIQEILKNRTALVEALSQISYVVTCYPSDANFVLAKVDDANKRYQQLLDLGIVVRNRSTQLHCENSLRFTVGTSGEIKELIAALKKIDQ